MTSGIYQLTFPNGHRYIGKSINIQERWNQHLDKMTKGTAAKSMQQAWNTYQNFDCKVIFECHPDHIDIMEECFISRLNPELNTTRPKDRLPGLINEDFDNVVKYFKLSTLEHVTLLEQNSSDLLKYQKTIASLESNLVKLSKRRNKEELAADISSRIADLESDVGLLETLLDRANNNVKVLKASLEHANRPWWQKLFS